jgi:transcription antitermination protein NusB
MAAGRRSARRQAVFSLYRQDLLNTTAEAALASYSEVEIDPYARRLVRGSAVERDRIDALLRQHLSDWSLERLGILERSILRIATYELLAAPDVPEAVIIDEAVTLAKRYCSAEAGALVNGVLGSVVASHCTASRPSGSGAGEHA